MSLPFALPPCFLAENTIFACTTAIHLPTHTAGNTMIDKHVWSSAFEAEAHRITGASCCCQSLTLIYCVFFQLLTVFEANQYQLYRRQV